MNHPFLALELEYSRRLARLKITRRLDVTRRAIRLVRPDVTDHFRPTQEKLGIPIVWMVASFERESSSDFSRSPAQGDRWDRISTHVPRGAGPFKSFADAALWSYQHDGMAQKDFPWTPAYACYAWERFNGFGPRDHGRVSGYVFSGTDQYDPPLGQGGKYVADGVWNGVAVDLQLGCVALALAMIEIDPTLNFAPTLPVTPIEADVTPTPLGHGGDPKKHRDTAWIQKALNLLTVSGTPLVVDGSYGRRTANAIRAFQASRNLEADGLCGRKTFVAIDRALDALPKNKPT